MRSVSTLIDMIVPYQGFGLMQVPSNIIVQFFWMGEHEYRTAKALIRQYPTVRESTEYTVMLNRLLVEKRR